MGMEQTGRWKTGWSCFTGGEVTVDCKLRRVIHAQHQLTRFYFSTFTMPHAPWPDKSLTNTKLFMNSLQRLMVFSLILFCVSAHAQTEQVGVWMKYEKTFESQKTYDNPLYDIRRFVVHFTSPFERVNFPLTTITPSGNLSWLKSTGPLSM